MDAGLQREIDSRECVVSLRLCTRLFEQRLWATKLGHAAGCPQPQLLLSTVELQQQYPGLGLGLAR